MRRAHSATAPCATWHGTSRSVPTGRPTTYELIAGALAWTFALTAPAGFGLVGVAGFVGSTLAGLAVWAKASATGHDKPIATAATRAPRRCFNDARIHPSMNRCGASARRLAETILYRDVVGNRSRGVVRLLPNNWSVSTG